MTENIECESLQALLRCFLASDLLNTASDSQSCGGSCQGVGAASSCVCVPRLSVSERCSECGFTRHQIREARGANKRTGGQINKRETSFCLGRGLWAKPGAGKQPQGERKFVDLFVFEQQNV